MPLTKKRITKFVFALATIYMLLNYSWIHGAAASVLAERCNEQLFDQSRARVAGLFRTTESEPFVACLSSPALGIDISHGQTRFAPGLPSVVLIGPKGMNEDVIAHELVHAELASRLGVIKRQLKVPIWVDEGLAMQVDHRLDYNAEALAAYHARDDLSFPDLDTLATTKFFVTGDQGKYHYAYSRCLVGQWISTERNWVSKIQAWSNTDNGTAIVQRGCSKTE